MKVLVIPDIHLKPYLFTRARDLIQSENIDTTVCLMDIPDDWNQQYQIELYAQTFNAAIDFAKEYPRSLWCYGNHDVCYLWNERETGYSSVASYTVQKKLMELNAALPADNPIKYIQKIDQVVFCHGGICDYFVENHIPASKYDDIDYVIETINSLGHYELWHDDSPLWYRPQHYQGKMYNSEKLLQVVGHTPMKKIERDGNVISCDVFSTYQDGTPIGTQEFLVIDTDTWEFYGIK